jgi:hypothetical protein
MTNTFQGSPKCKYRRVAASADLAGLVHLRAAGLARHPPDIGAEPGQLGLDAFITAVEMVDAVDGGLALGGQRGDDQPGGSAQIGGHDRRTA